ncbi:MAG TPA: hypothetical protein VI893_04345, partial [Thermoplasmata archaeon]|nr:hypothetical protein [Thermoplasmata archaeon]
MALKSLAVFVALLPLAYGALTSPGPTSGADRHEGFEVTSTTKTPVFAQAIPQFLVNPKATDINSGGFRVSWLADQQVTATLYWADVPSPVAWNTSGDGPVTTQNGAVVLETTGVLGTEKDYWWRVSMTNGAESANYPGSGSVLQRTHTSTTISCGSNPRIEAAPFDDRNSNGLYDGQPTDQPQFRFLIYLDHSAAYSLVSRGGEADGYLWNGTLETERLVGATPGEDYHCVVDHHTLPGSATFDFQMHGLYDGGGGKKYWSNTSAIYIWPDSHPLFPDVQYPTATIPEAGPRSAAVAAVALGAGAFLVLNVRRTPA